MGVSAEQYEMLMFCFYCATSSLSSQFGIVGAAAGLVATTVLACCTGLQNNFAKGKLHPTA